ncbi:MAG: silver transporter [Solibacillus sp.]|uniref:silver transporter n=1 Tax=unclassified Solibacillus TaxID=2637870 RepID=UPI003101985E
MTSIVTVSPARNVWEQVKWKCQTSSSMFSTIILVHLILGFLTSGGTGSFSTGGSFLSFEARTYTLDVAFLYSIILMLGIGWMLASGALSRDQFSIVTTNQTEVVSTFFFFVLLSIFTFVSSVCMLCISVAIEMLKLNEPLVVENQFFSVSTMAMFIVCMLVASTMGYFIRTVFQFSKVLLGLLTVLLFLLIRMYGVDSWSAVFGTTSAEIIGRSSLYVVLLWGAIFVMRLRREVNR